MSDMCKLLPCGVMGSRNCLMRKAEREWECVIKNILVQLDRAPENSRYCNLDPSTGLSFYGLTRSLITKYVHAEPGYDSHIL